METNPARGHLAALLFFFFWGTTLIYSKVLLVDFQPVEILFIRFMMGFLALLADLHSPSNAVKTRHQKILDMGEL